MKKGWGLKRAGFTIVELIIVVVTIGIISTIVTVSYRAVVNNGHDVAVQGDLKKLADIITLEALDEGAIPEPGAAWNAGAATGNSTILPDITFSPVQDSYFRGHTNLYYCVDVVNGVEEFAVMARSLSGNSFAYRSDSGATQLTGLNVGESSNPEINCGAVDMTNQVRWSYGYNPAPEFLWFGWADAS